MSQSVLLDAGENALVQAQASKEAVRLDSFKIGDAANVDPQVTDTDITGNLVYTGSATEITTTVVQNDSIQFKITLDEGVGDFDIGNLVLFTDEDEPFMKMSLNNQADKKASNPPQQIGNRQVFNIGLRYNNIDQLVDVNILTTTYASPPPGINNVNIPDAGVANYDMYLLQNHTNLGTPTIAIRRNSDDTWFSFPLSEPMEDAFFGVLDGGVDNDQHLRGSTYAVGGSYLHDFNFSSTIDGGQLDNSAFVGTMDFGNL